MPRQADVRHWIFKSLLARDQGARSTRMGGLSPAKAPLLCQGRLIGRRGGRRKMAISGLEVIIFVFGSAKGVLGPCAVLARESALFCSLRPYPGLLACPRRRNGGNLNLSKNYQFRASFDEFGDLDAGVAWALPVALRRPSRIGWPACALRVHMRRVGLGWRRGAVCGVR